MNPQRTRAGLIPESITQRDGLRIVERRSLSADGSRVRKSVAIEFADGTSKCWEEDVRLYEPDEIGILLEANGFVREAIWGNFEGAPFDLDSDRQLLRARVAV
jgi:hypothetical protein